MSGREFVKILLAKECMTIKELAKLASENSDKKYTLDGLSDKMRLGTLRFDDVEFFAKLLGYEIELKKIEKNNSRLNFNITIRYILIIFLFKLL